MKKIILSVSVIAVAAILTSCSTTMPLSVSAASVGSKTGVSSTVVLFANWELNKEYGIGQAAKNGGIKGSVATADLKVTNYLIFRKKEIIVQGN